MFRESADGTGVTRMKAPGYFRICIVHACGYLRPFDVIKNDPRVSQVIVRGGTGTPDGERVNTNDNRYLSLKWYTPKKNVPLFG